MPLHRKLMESQANATTLVKLLSANAPSAPLTTRLKFSLRPYICPFHLLLPFVEAGLKYYDLGCGSGAFLRLLAEYKHPKALGGAEVSGQLIDHANSVLKGRVNELQLRQYDGFDIPAEVADYNYVFLIDVLHHIPRAEQDGFLRRLVARMEPGQRLVLKDIDAGSRLAYWNKVHDVLLSQQIGHERHFRAMTTFLQQIGLTVEHAFTKRVLLYPHYVLICAKT